MNSKIDNGSLILFLEGELNSSNSEDTEKEIENIMSNAKFNSVVFDCDKLNYISSAGLRIILRVKKERDNTKVINVNNGVFEIFDMVGFTNVLEVERKA